MGKKRVDEQLDLFGAADAGLGDARRAELTAIAAGLPPGLRFGTSSWTFRGWQGVVYASRYPNERAFVRDSLAEYARHPLFRSVGIDRSYYAPVPEEDLQRWALQTPDDFVPITKVWSELTTAVFPNHPRHGVRAGRTNPRFLDVGAFRELVLGPTRRAFGRRRVPFVVELPASPIAPRDLEKRLDTFLGEVASEARIAVELRRPEWLTTRHLDMLHAHGATHVFNYWERMPTLRAQLALPRAMSGPYVVARILIPPGRRYAEEKERFAPFDAIVERQPAMRDDVVELIRRAEELRFETFVIVNNKAEGSSPYTIEELATRLTQR